MPRKCLNILWGLRAVVCYGIACCVTHLYVRVSWQPHRLRKNALSKTIAISVLIFLAITANAQTPDTTVVDTTSFSTYDPETQSSELKRLMQPLPDEEIRAKEAK